MNMIRFIKTLFALLTLIPLCVAAQSGHEAILKAKHTSDFTVTGDGTAPNWNNTEWLVLPQRNKASFTYATKVKVLYSDAGIYCLYDCEDKKIGATLKEDFLDLYNEDVVEAFFWTDETIPMYLEYELSPLNYELPILVPNFKGSAYGWLPWHYEGKRRTKHATHINKNGETVTSWRVEFFIPFALYAPLKNVPPKKGTQWRANFYRIDYDEGQILYTWQPVRKESFHDYERFGTLLFD
jgi:hypothetical protein